MKKVYEVKKEEMKKVNEMKKEEVKKITEKKKEEVKNIREDAKKKMEEVRKTNRATTIHSGQVSLPRHAPFLKCEAYGDGVDSILSLLTPSTNLNQSLSPLFKP
jgi:hypothetical protein